MLSLLGEMSLIGHSTPYRTPDPNSTRTSNRGQCLFCKKSLCESVSVLVSILCSLDIVSVLRNWSEVEGEVPGLRGGGRGPRGIHPRRT